MARAKRLAVAYMPFRIHVQRIFIDLIRPWVVGFDLELYIGMGRTRRCPDVAPAVLATKRDA